MKTKEVVEEGVREILKGTGGELDSKKKIIRFGPAVSPENIVNVSEQVKRAGVVVGKTEIRGNELIIPLETARGFN